MVTNPGVGAKWWLHSSLCTFIANFALFLWKCFFFFFWVLSYLFSYLCHVLSGRRTSLKNAVKSLPCPLTILVTSININKIRLLYRVPSNHYGPNFNCCNHDRDIEWHCKTNRLRKSFIATSVRLINSSMWRFHWPSFSAAKDCLLIKLLYGFMCVAADSAANFLLGLITFNWTELNVPEFQRLVSCNFLNLVMRAQPKICKYLWHRILHC